MQNSGLWLQPSAPAGTPCQGRTSDTIQVPPASADGHHEGALLVRDRGLGAVDPDLLERDPAREERHAHALVAVELHGELRFEANDVALELAAVAGAAEGEAARALVAPGD